jgi:hypothetical protein
MLDSLTAEHFRPRIGETYRLVPLDAEAGAPVETELVSVTDLTAYDESPRQPFDVIFRAPAGTDLGQGTFRVEHATADALELFVVPIGPGPEGEGTLYQAIFA